MFKPTSSLSGRKHTHAVWMEAALFIDAQMSFTSFAILLQFCLDFMQFQLHVVKINAHFSPNTVHYWSNLHIWLLRFTLTVTLTCVEMFLGQTCLNIEAVN